MLVEDRAYRDVLLVQRSLGTYWCMNSDTIGFRFELKDKPVTRREILSTVSLVYDPLGVVAPVILVGKPRSKNSATMVSSGMTLCQITSI